MALAKCSDVGDQASSATANLSQPTELSRDVEDDSLSPKELEEYTSLFQGLPICVRRTPERGRGLYATQNIPKGTVIFKEMPLLAMQSLLSRADCAVCSHCLRFVGSLEGQLELLARRQTLQTLGNDISWHLPCRPSGLPDLKPILRCSWGCGELYCSPECRANAEPYHKLLCVAQVTDETAPLYQFKIHAMNTNEVFLLCGRVYANIIADHQQSGCWTKALLPYRQFQGGVWWDIAVPTGGQTLEELKASLQESCALSATLLKQAFSDVSNVVAGLSSSSNQESCVHCGSNCNALLQHMFTTEFMAELVGIFERNQHGIRMQNPLVRYFSVLKQSEDAPSECVELEAVLGDIADAIHAEAVSCCDEHDSDADGDPDEEDEEDSGKGAQLDPNRCSNLAQAMDNPEEWFPPLDGQGVFRKASLMNHSCEPNCTVQYPSSGQDPVQALIIAVRDIAAGEELQICYLDAASMRDDTTTRQQALRDYGFSCQCKRCTSE